MPTQHDVLIIGAGVIGACMAHYLLDAGREVTIIDKGRLGGGASHGNAGYIVPSHATPLASPTSLREGITGLLNPDSPFYIKPRFNIELFRWLTRFALASRQSQADRNRPILRDLSMLSAELFQDLIPRGELDCDYEKLGLLEAYNDHDRFDEGKVEAQQLLDIGLNLTILDRDETLATEPALREDIVGSVLMQQDAHLNPARFMAEMGQWLIGRGANVLTETEVTGVSVTGRSVTALHTPTGDHTANEYVLAAGSWSPLIGNQLGLRIPIQPAKGYSITQERPENGPRLPTLLMESRVAITPFGRLLRYAGTLEMAGIDTSINERRVQAINDAIPRYYKSWPETPIVETWAGMRPVTPDGLPIIGRPAHLDNLFLATGHAMLGLSLSAATGHLAAQYLTGLPPDLDLTPFRPARFR